MPEFEWLRRRLGMRPSEKWRAEMRANVEETFANVRATLDEYRSTPLDVAATTDDRRLNDHLLMRLERLEKAGDGDPIDVLHPDLRAFLVTHVFEHEVASGGPSGFLAFGGPAVARHVAAGYRRLGLEKAAATFEEVWASPTMVALREAFDREDLDAEIEEGDLWPLIEAIGQNDAARIAYVRAHPETFSI